MEAYGRRERLWRCTEERSLHESIAATRTIRMTLIRHRSNKQHCVQRRQHVSAFSVPAPTLIQAQLYHTCYTEALRWLTGVRMEAPSRLITGVILAIVRSLLRLKLDRLRFSTPGSTR
jgi:hypothetical protein